MGECVRMNSIIPTQLTEVLLLTIEELDGMYLQAHLFQWFVS